MEGGEGRMLGWEFETVYICVTVELASSVCPLKTIGKSTYKLSEKCKATFFISESIE
jgi:hypothetical protein